MKRIAAILAVIALACFVVTAISLTMNGFNAGDINFLKFWSSDKTDYDDLEDVNHDGSYSISDFSNINLDIVSAKCQFFIEDRSDIRVVYKGKGKFTADISSETLNIIETFKGFHVFSIRSGSLLIYLPKDFHKDLKLKSVSGDFNFGNLLSDTLNVSSVSGDINVTSVRSNEVTLNTISGDIDLKDFSFENLSSKTVSGSADIDTLGDWSSIKASSVSGKVTLSIDSNIKPSIKYKSVSGDLKSDFGTTGDSGKTITVSTTSGDLIVKSK